jgi:HAD superfamily hydrolase (TIGR01484 family)
LKPLDSLGFEEARRLRGVFFDLDDTVLTQGLLTRAAYDAMWALHDAGLALAVVTGRPSGWCDVLARQWPIHGCVAENGAVDVVRRSGRVEHRDSCAAEERAARRGALESLIERVRVRVPEAKLADDNHVRRADVAWDIGEHERLQSDRVRVVIDEIERSGARALQSSVHLHATYDGYDKASGALRFCAREFQEDAAQALVRFAFVGDSGNDAPCFAAFRTSFGVANVRAGLANFTVGPRYVARESMGKGFAEIVAAILRKR